MRRGVRRGSLRAKIIAWSFVPTLIILVATAIVTFYAFQQMTGDLVFGRDKELTVMAAGQVALQLAREPDLLVLVSAYSIYRNEPSYQNLIVNLVGGVVSLRAGSGGSAYLVHKDGRVIYHTESRYQGADFSGQAVVQKVLAGESGALRTTGPDGQDVIASYAPVPGTPWGLVNQESWETLTSASRGYRQLLLVLLALLLIVPAVVTTIGVRQITQPMDRLADAAGQIARGNFDQRITASTGDILEELADQFNHMAVRLQESYTHLEQRVSERTKELATLNALAASLSESWDLDTSLNRALDVVMGLLDVEVGEVRVWKEGQGLVVHAQRGPVHEFPRLMGLAESGAALPQETLPTEPLIVDNTRGYGGDVAWSEGVRALAVFPLRVKEEPLGILSLATERGPRPFTTEELALLRAVSDQVGLAVENARLQEEARQRAVVEERNRLARELHDSVAQTLYGVTLYAEATARQLSAGDVTLAADHLYVLQEMAQEALREMRLLVFELRPSVLLQEGLAAALQARLEAVEGRGGLVTELNADGVGRLPLETEEGIYRIVQEALNNVLKHSRARHVTVSLHWDAESMVLEVADDGVGFDLAGAREHGGLGLRGMEERAARMGGRLTIQSAAGAGTRVTLEVRP